MKTENEETKSALIAAIQRFTVDRVIDGKDAPNGDTERAIGTLSRLSELGELKPETNEALADLTGALLCDTIELRQAAEGFFGIDFRADPGGAKREPDNVDDFIDDHGPGDSREVSYARWMLHHFRMPAVWQMHFAPFMADRRLFATWGGKRYRVTGASRMGDVWIATDFERDCGYDHRVDVRALSDWGAEP